MDIPNIPYDNLYKFMAIFGLILIVFGMVFPVYSYFDLRGKYSKEIYDKQVFDSKLDELKTEFDKNSEAWKLTIEGWDKVIVEKVENFTLLSNRTKQRINKVNSTLDAFQNLFNKAGEILKKSGCFDVTENEGIAQITAKEECIGKQITNKEEIMAYHIVTEGYNQFKEYFNAETKQIEENLAAMEMFNLELGVINETISLDGKSYIEKFKEMDLETERLVETQDKVYYAYKEYKTRENMRIIFSIISSALAIIGLIICLIGFRRWHENQEIIDKSMKLDLEIKRLTYEKHKRRLFIQDRKRSK